MFERFVYGCRDKAFSRLFCKFCTGVWDNTETSKFWHQFLKVLQKKNALLSVLQKLQKKLQNFTKLYKTFQTLK